VEAEIEGLIDFFTRRSTLYGPLIIFGYKARVTGGQVRAASDAEEVHFFHPDSLPPLAFRSHEKLIAAWRGKAEGGRGKGSDRRG
jgi:hypothetical protein